MAVKPPQDTLTIDPIAMNVVNRVAPGSVLSGELTFEGGLLVQGEVSGHIRVNGRLIVWTGGVVQATQLACQGMAFVSKTGVSTGSLEARRLQLYEGADLQGPFKTLKLKAQTQ
jgi:cytoskeletal protein CcmA (bactofilin family)